MNRRCMSLRGVFLNDVAISGCKIRTGSLRHRTSCDDETAGIPASHSAFLGMTSRFICLFCICFSASRVQNTLPSSVTCMVSFAYRRESFREEGRKTERRKAELLLPLTCWKLLSSPILKHISWKIGKETKKRKGLKAGSGRWVTGNGLLTMYARR